MDIEHLLNYYLWADERLILRIDTISEEDFNHHSDSYRSIRQLVEHYVNGYEYLWLSQEGLEKRPQELADMSRSELMDNWKSSLHRFVEKALSLEGPQQAPIGKGKTVEMDRDNYLLLHTDHATYHRGQIVGAMKRLGYEGINTDYYSVILEN